MIHIKIHFFSSFCSWPSIALQFRIWTWNTSHIFIHSFIHSFIRIQFRLHPHDRCHLPWSPKSPPPPPPKWSPRGSLAPRGSDRPQTPKWPHLQWSLAVPLAPCWTMQAAKGTADQRPNLVGIWGMVSDSDVFLSVYFIFLSKMSFNIHNHHPCIYVI